METIACDVAERVKASWAGKERAMLALCGMCVAMVLVGMMLFYFDITHDGGEGAVMDMLLMLTFALLAGAIANSYIDTLINPPTAEAQSEPGRQD